MDNEQLITSAQMEEALLRIQNKLGNTADTGGLQEQITANAENIASISTQLTSKANSSALTDGSVTKLGTATVGGSAKPIYLSSGTATACSSTVGSATQPIYMSSGTMTACNTTVGGSAKPIYSSSGVLTACSSTVGSGTQPVYMSSGTITACGTTVGSGTKPIYSSSGVLTASSSTVGSGVIPVYLSSGTITASSSTVGSGTKPVYLSSGTITVSSSTVGSGTKPVFLSSGTITVSSSTVGSTTTPVYLNSGTITACNGITVASFTSDQFDVSAESYAVGPSIDVSKSGKTPIGICGWSVANGSTAYANRVFIYRAYVSGTTLNFRVHNTASSTRNVQVTFYVFYT